MNSMVNGNQGSTMNTTSRPALVWTIWLTVVSIGVALFGLLLVIAPALARVGFSLLIYLDADHVSSFGLEATAYIGLAHAVLGSVMIGWGSTLVLVVRKQFAKGSWLGWQIIAISVSAWFVPDSVYSIWSGFWHNAVLNVVFAVLFLVPLMATYRVCRR